MAYPPRPNMAQEEPPASWRARRRKLGSVWFPSCSTTGTHAPRRVKAATHEGHPAPWLAGELDPKGAHSEERQGFTSLSEGAVPASFARLLFAPLGSSRGGGARAWQTVS